MDQNTPAVDTLLSVEGLIKSYQGRLDTLTKEYKEHKEMLKNTLENNDEYMTAFESAQKAAKLKTIAKQKALKDPGALSLVEKIKDYQSQLKELKTSLSDYLAQYVSLSGTNQIEGPDGAPLQIIYSAHLVKKAP